MSFDPEIQAPAKPTFIGTPNGEITPITEVPDASEPWHANLKNHKTALGCLAVSVIGVVIAVKQH